MNILCKVIMIWYLDCLSMFHLYTDLVSKDKAKLIKFSSNKIDVGVGLG